MDILGNSNSGECLFSGMASSYTGRSYGGGGYRATRCRRSKETIMKDKEARIAGERLIKLRESRMKTQCVQDIVFGLKTSLLFAVTTVVLIVISDYVSNTTISVLTVISAILLVLITGGTLSAMLGYCAGRYEP